MDVGLKFDLNMHCMCANGNLSFAVEHRDLTVDPMRGSLNLLAEKFQLLLYYLSSHFRWGNFFHVAL